MEFDWKTWKMPIIAVGVIILLIVIVWMIILWTRVKTRPPTPMQLLVKNMKASSLPVDAREVWLKGNPQTGAIYWGKLAGTLYAPQIVALLVKPSWGRAGFGCLWERHVLLVTRGDMDDLRGRRTYIKGTGAMQYINDLYWLQPDLSDKATRTRWGRTLGYKGEPFESADSAEVLLPLVAAWYRHAMVSFLAVQEELVAMDLNARMRRAIPFSHEPRITRDVPEDEQDESADQEEDDAPPQEASQ